MLATIGRNSAVAVLGRLHLSGYPAWLLWLRRPHLLPDRLPQPAHRADRLGLGLLDLRALARVVAEPARAPD